jgi:phage tail protein X
MRKVSGFVARTAVTAAVLLAFPALTAHAQLPVHAAPPAQKSDTSPFDVVPGDDIEIACDAVEKRAADSDVRVVLTISAVPGDTGPGYAKVLATDEQVLKDAVRVRIPDLPTLEDHTVGLDVYVVGDSTAQHCDAGRVKIS